MRITWLLPLSAITVIAALSAIGCDNQACTLIACLPTIDFDVRAADGTPVSEFSATVMDGSERIDICCRGQTACLSDTGDAVCTQTGFTLWRAPDSVAVTVTATTSGNGTYSGMVEPDYATQYPNGKSCGGGCRAGSELLMLTP